MPFITGTQIKQIYLTRLENPDNLKKENESASNIDFIGSLDLK
jgi:hypothetical protein